MKSGIVRSLICGAVLLLLPLSATAGDWLHWRGPEQNGVSRDKDLPDRWSPSPGPNSNLIWTQPYGCRSTPIIHKDRVYFINTAGQGQSEQERVMCLNADTGKLLWEHRFNVFQTTIVSSRLGWTSPAGDPETGNIYVHGTQGLLFCFDKDGKILWKRSLTEEYGRVSGYGGRLVTPIVDGDLVVVGFVNSSWGPFSRGACRYVAFDKKTGEVAWWSSMPGRVRGTYYSSPVIAVINGERLLITGGATGMVHAMKVRTGELVWSYAFAAGVINSSPVVAGNRVFISQGEENLDSPIQGRIICLDASKVKDGKPELVWEVGGVKAGYATPVIHEGVLYVVDDTAKLHAYEADAGKEMWNLRFGRLGRGSPVWGDGKLYVFEVNARFHILQPGPTRCKRLHSQFFPGGGKGFVETNGTPAIVNGRVYLATRDAFYCIGKKDHKAKPDPIPPMAKEPAVNPKAAVAHLQVLPADVVLKPGESVSLRVRAFNEKGQFLRELPAKWSMPTPKPPPGVKGTLPALKGEINAKGKLTVARDVPNQQGYVAAKVNDLTGSARVRVVPAIPFKINLAEVPDGGVPGGVVNCLGKFMVVTLADGTKALKKRAHSPRPPFSRAWAYLGKPSETGYTIQADFLGKEVRGNLPDMGLTSTRYTLFLTGKRDPKDKRQRLRLVSWEAQGRVNHNVPFDWKPDVWYRIKLTVNVEKDRAVCQGKVWPVGKPEPAEWTTEFTDMTPNREGAAAVYGYATGVLADAPGAEALVRNISVAANKAGARVPKVTVPQAKVTVPPAKVTVPPAKVVNRPKAELLPEPRPEGVALKPELISFPTVEEPVQAQSSQEEAGPSWSLPSMFGVWALLALVPLLLFRIFTYRK